MTQPPDPFGVWVGGQQIYEAVVKLTGKVDVLIEQQTANQQDIQDHEQRLRRVEQRMWPLPTVSIVIALISVGFAVIPRLQ